MPMPVKIEMRLLDNGTLTRRRVFDLLHPRTLRVLTKGGGVTYTGARDRLTKSFGYTRAEATSLLAKAVSESDS